MRLHSRRTAVLAALGLGGAACALPPAELAEATGSGAAAGAAGAGGSGAAAGAGGAGGSGDGERCESAVSLALPASLTNESLDGLAHDYTLPAAFSAPQCGSGTQGNSGPDRVYRAHVPLGSTLDVTVTPGPWDAMLVVVSGTASDCGPPLTSPGIAGCFDSQGTGLAETGWVQGVEGQDVFVIVGEVFLGAGPHAFALDLTTSSL